MPVLTKDAHHELMLALTTRYDALMGALQPRELHSSTEGVKGRGSWVDYKARCATEGSAMDVRLAVEDFKAVLAEIRTLK